MEYLFSILTISTIAHEHTDNIDENDTNTLYEENFSL